MKSKEQMLREISAVERLLEERSKLDLAAREKICEALDAEARAILELSRAKRTLTIAYKRGYDASSKYNETSNRLDVLDKQLEKVLMA